MAWAAGRQKERDCTLRSGRENQVKERIGLLQFSSLSNLTQFNEPKFNEHISSPAPKWTPLLNWQHKPKSTWSIKDPKHPDTESRCSVHFISFRNIEELLKEWNKQVTIVQSDKNSIKSLFMLTLQFYQGWASKNLPDSMTTWLNANEQLHLMQKRFAPTKVWKKIFQLFPLQTMEHLSNIFLFFLQHDNIGTQLEQ